MTLILYTEDAKNEGQDFGWTLARVTGRDGSLLTPNDVEAVSLSVFDVSIPGSAAIYTDTTIDPEDVLFDTPQHGAIWTLPDEGYDFAHYLTAALAFGTTDEVGGDTYLIKYLLTTTARNASGSIPVVRRVKVNPLP